MFFYVLIFLIIFVVIILFSKIKIDIQNVKISTEKIMNRNINEKYKIVIVLRVLNIMNILRTEITKDKLEKIKLKNKLRNLKIRKISLKEFDINKFKILNKHKPDIKFINLIINMGVEDAVLTSYSVAILSSILGIVLNKTISYSSESKFIVNPIYANKNLLNLELDCIIEIKMIHIIYIIYILNKKRRDDKYVRTSNRGAYDYSYE